MACLAAYAAFHAVRPDLPRGIVWGSAPSFLLPIAMAASLDLAPRVRFNGAGARAIAVLAATAASAVWFEAVAPAWTSATIGDWRDAVAMLAGGAVAAGLPAFTVR